MMPLHTSSSKLALSKVLMSEEAEAAADAPAEAEGSILDSLSGVPAELLEKIKGLTLEEAAALIKDVDKTFGLKKDDDEEDGDAEA